MHPPLTSYWPVIHSPSYSPTTHFIFTRNPLTIICTHHSLHIHPQSTHHHMHPPTTSLLSWVLNNGFLSGTISWFVFIVWAAGGVCWGRGGGCRVLVVNKTAVVLLYGGWEEAVVDQCQKNGLGVRGCRRIQPRVYKEYWNFLHVVSIRKNVKNRAALLETLNIILAICCWHLFQCWKH